MRYYRTENQRRSESIIINFGSTVPREPNGKRLYFGDEIRYLFAGSK